MERYLIGLIAEVISQTESVETRWRPSWEWIYKISDYHHVSNLIYYKVMWSDDPHVVKWKERFEDRYRNAMRLQERNRRLRKQLETELERREIHSVFTGESIVLEYYQRPEMRIPEPIELLVQKKKYDDARSLILSMGFEEVKDAYDHGTGLFARIPDQKIRLYDALPFTGRKIKSWFKELPGELPKEEDRRYIHCMNEETVYIYFICRLADKFARGQMEIRDIVDFWLLLSKEGPELKWKEIREELESLELDTFGEYIAKLAGKWFGNMYFREDNDLLNDMQTYIISKGERGRRESEDVLPLITSVVDSYHRDLKKEEKKKLREWRFPSIDYMASSFPRLKKWPVLLPAYWILRLMKNRKFRKKREAETQESEE